MSVGKRLALAVCHNKPRLFGSVVVTIVSVLATLGVPLFIGNAIDSLISKTPQDFFTNIIIAAVLVAIATVTSYFSNRLANIIATKTASRLRLDALNALYNAPISKIDTIEAGEAAARISGDADTVTDGLVAALSQLISGAVTIVATLVLMFMLDYRVAFAVGALTPLSMLFAIILTKKMRRYFKENAAIKGQMSAYSLNVGNNIKTLKLYGQQQQSYDDFCKINDKLYTAGFKSQFSSSIVNPGARLINAFVYTAVTVLGAYLVIKKQITVGQLSIFLAYANQYSKPFNEITTVIAELQSALSSAERIFALIDLEPENGDEPISEVCLNGHISIENIAFSYSSGRLIFDGLCLDIPSGTSVGLVGASGSGKSTLINLLMRFYDVNSGKILIDEKNIKDIQRLPLRKQFGMVLQEGVIFNRSVAENIAFINKDATISQIKQAAMAANCHHFIDKLANGYDTILNDSVQLSAGQEQLICIARVMLMNPNIFILDEATSNIDTRYEQSIHSGFKKLSKGKTSITVAHRLAAVMDSDLIIVLDKGKIIEVGNHDTLMRKNGTYAEMFRISYQ